MALREGRTRVDSRCGWSRGDARTLVNQRDWIDRGAHGMLHSGHKSKMIAFYSQARFSTYDPKVEKIKRTFEEIRDTMWVTHNTGSSAAY